MSRGINRALRPILIMGLLGVVFGFVGDGLHRLEGLRLPSPFGGSQRSHASAERGCKTAKRPVRVRVPRSKWPHVADHVADIRGRFPKVWHIARAGADENREESLRGVKTRPGYDRDEWPPAMAREGGAGADVRLVESSENRSQGSAMGARLRPFCTGQAFRVVVVR